MGKSFKKYKYLHSPSIYTGENIVNLTKYFYLIIIFLIEI